jgi:molybdenum cofactor synthesis domain-containing protein
MATSVDRTAGMIVIGNEILSGKVTDTNTPYLARELRALGVTLRRIVTVSDEPPEIAAAVRELGPRYDVVFTSGGVGPTHDDVTMEGIALGLDRKVIRHPLIEGRLREFYGDKVNEARLKMSEVPEGSELIVDGRLGFPTIKCENLYILPGIPEIFEQKFQALRERFVATPYILKVVYTREGEGGIAQHLNATLAAFPQLLLGSYPKIGHPEYAVKLTLESKDAEYVDRALAHLLALLPADAVVRTE